MPSREHPAAQDHELPEFTCTQCGWTDTRPDKCTRCGSLRTPSAARTPERKRLFWKQIEQARKDVGEWPNYLKHAFGVKPLDR